MKIKTKKILAISLGISFGVITLATSSAAIASCSSATIEPSVPNVPVEPNQPEESIKTILVNKNNISNVGTNLNNNVSNITINQFNYFFNENENALTNKQTFIEKLGIQSHTNDIESIQASGNYDNASITITAKEGFKFVENSETSNLPKLLSNVQCLIQNNTIKYEHVTFSQYATISNFVQNINLDNKFTTITNNNSLSEPSSGLKQEITTKISSENNFQINIWSLTNQYFNVSLPQTVDGLFDVTGMGINGATIKWSIEGSSNNFAINNNQFLYNTQSIESNSITLIANINQNNNKVANDVKINLNFKYGVILNQNELQNTFSCNGFNTHVQSLPNIFYVDFNNQAYLTKSTENTEGAAPVEITANINNLCCILKTSLQPFFDKLEIQEINWGIPVPNYYPDFDAPNFSNWSGNESTLDEVVTFPSLGYCDVYWTATISFTDKKTPPIEIKFYVSLDVKWI